MLSSRHHEMLLVELTRVVSGTFPKAAPDQARDWVSEFFALYPQRPISNNTWGSGFHNLFWLYMTCRLLQPNVIVESGILRGQTTWLLRSAVPDALIHAFDIDFRPIQYRDPTAIYHECDWNESDVTLPVDVPHLAFFDCHVNHARRIIEAHERGFRTLVFDDNLPVHKLYSDGLPAFPTVEIVMNGDLEDGEVIPWLWRGQERAYVFNSEEADRARALVAECLVLPDVGTPTRFFGGFSFLSFVELRA